MDECSSACILAPFAQPAEDNTLDFQSGPFIPSDHVDERSKLYRPIHDWQTRVLELAPGLPGSSLSSRLLTVDIILKDGVVVHDEQRRMDFEALSYTWGEPVFRRPFEVNGIDVAITENLFRALHRLRYQDQSRMLWIDALCINQSDTDERSRQVQAMLSIFRKAKRVLVWLGEHKRYTQMCTGAVKLDDLHQGNKISLDNLLPRACVNHLRRLRRASCEMLERPWFQRLWIRQEIWAARDAIVCCGAESLAWKYIAPIADLADELNEIITPRCSLTKRPEAYSTAFEYLAPASTRALRFVEDLEVVGDIDEESIRRELNHTQTDILGVMSYSVNAQCSDPQDRVYGVLGMTAVSSISAHLERMHKQSNAAVQEAQNRWALRVHYSRPVRDVFVDLATWILNSQNNLDLLFFNARFGGSVEGQILPSWCPDWRFGVDENYFHAYEGPTYDFSPVSDRQFHIDGRSLHIRGLLLGHVVTGSGGHDDRGDYGINSSSLRVFGDVSIGDALVSVKGSLAALAIRRQVHSGFAFVGWTNVRDEGSHGLWRLDLQSKWKPARWWGSRYQDRGEQEFEIV